MEEINVSSEQLFETSHTLWTYESQQTAEAQKNRKDLLRDAVNRTFDFGKYIFVEIVKSGFTEEKGTCIMI